MSRVAEGVLRARRAHLGAALCSALSLLATCVASGAPVKSSGHGRPRGASHGVPSPPAKPVAPLPMLPSIPRVRVEVMKAQLIVIEEVNLPRGEWRGEPLDFYVAFGAPGAPRALDAHLIAVADGMLEPEEGDVGEPLVVDRAAHRPASAHPLIGPDAMAGVIVHVKSEVLVRGLARGNMVALRLRTALDLPGEDRAGARGLVVRLGASRGTPLTLGRISLTERPGALSLTRGEARLCGPDAVEAPLAIALTGPQAATRAGAAPTPLIAPVLAVRHVTDDLCIRFWTQAEAAPR